MRLLYAVTQWTPCIYINEHKKNGKCLVFLWQLFGCRIFVSSWQKKGVEKTTSNYRQLATLGCGSNLNTSYLELCMCCKCQHRWQPWAADPRSSRVTPWRRQWWQNILGKFYSSHQCEVTKFGIYPFLWPCHSFLFPNFFFSICTYKQTHLFKEYLYDFSYL